METAKGTMVLGEGDRYRVEMEGIVFGQAVRGTEVSDGTRTAYRDATDPKRDSTEESPKAAGAYLRGTLPRWGFFLCSLNMRRSGDLTPSAFELSGFKSGGVERVGGRNAHLIQYAFREKGPQDPLSMTMWLDAETHLPVKLAVTGGKSDWRAITETYGEFTIDAPVDAKQFELPKQLLCEQHGSWYLALMPGGQWTARVLRVDSLADGARLARAWIE